MATANAAYAFRRVRRRLDQHVWPSAPSGHSDPTPDKSEWLQPCYAHYRIKDVAAVQQQLNLCANNILSALFC